MKSIFLLPANITSPKVAQITEYLKEYPELNANTAWSEIQTYTEDALRINILKFIGLPLYNDIATKVQALETLSEPQTEFLQLLRATVCYYAALHFFPKKYSRTASAGIGHELSDKFQKDSLADYKITLWDITKTADRKLDLLLEFLEEQVKAENPYFDLYKNDLAYKKDTTPFFRSTASFQEYYNIFNSRPTFLALINAISDISEDTITPILCNDLFLEIATQLTTGELSEENQKLLHLIRRAVAPLAIAKAAPRLLCIVEADGFKIASNSDGMNMTKAAIDGRREAITITVQNAQAEGEKALNKLKKFIVDNRELYPLYNDSPCYRATIKRTSNFGVEVLTDNGTSAFIFKKR